MIELKTPEEFIARIKNRESVSRIDVSLAFEWDSVASAVLCESNLRGADLRGADLRGADLSGSNLRGADLSGSNLRGADLSGSNLRGADLCWSNLRGANLEKVVFSFGFSYSMPCEKSWAELRASLKNCDERLAQYLFVQHLAHSCAEDERMPFEVFRAYFSEPKEKKKED